MKTIELPDELCDKITSLAEEVQTQDNRSTANVFFQIQDFEKRYVLPYCSDETEWQDEDYNLLSEKDAFVYAWIDRYENTTEDEAKQKYSELDKYEVADILQDDGYNQVWFEWKPVYKNAFLTEKEAQRHLNANHHHYHPKAQVYGSSAWRNNNIECIREFLLNLK